MKFKCGDVVKVKDGINIAEKYGGNIIIGDINLIITINKVEDGYYKVKENPYNYKDEMLEEQRLPVVGDVVNRKGNKPDFCIKIDMIFYGEQNIYFEGIATHNEKTYGVLTYDKIQIIEPEPEYVICEEIEYYGNIGNKWISINNDVTNTVWKQPTGRKFKKFADGRLELVE